MRILHTADWHLGHRLYGNDRTEEHERALDWLLRTVRDRRVDLLIVAGDVFDSMNPSNTARNLYYRFLGQLQSTGCRTAVIVGGNHDSPSQLDAPASLLRHLNVHVIGGAREVVADQIIRITGADTSSSEVVIAAVPYLRDRDLKFSVVGESAGDKVERMRAAIRQHYQDVAAAARAARTDARTPIVATGHLFASGGEDADDKITNIYLADRNNIEAGHFDPCFDYVALGHIHRPQRVGGQEHIRYSGSLIPLTFGEAQVDQSVCLVELAGAGEPVKTEKIAVPTYRALVTCRGPVEEVKAALSQLVSRQRSADRDDRPPWVDIRVETPHPLPLLREELQEVVTPREDESNAGMNSLPLILRCTTVLPVGNRRQFEVETVNLEELHPEEVFHHLCHGGEATRPDYPELLESFRELRGWMEDQTGT
ncbi:exodeoxyribonuclease I subunit D [Neolewinella xylanilytica]|uniref:Nuclease SbcCD subunit D n=1 Tax=Neolewinella xylanilytica TaxID=1514080 RepID=A0A2S6I9Z0_9BACT|nr:exonuclease SbcCD subunit D C-terminal domain-containing protein [Neolewinella xylanilytica]PPK88306.1 exodeoxyribonuclease I subunit D [Neolewinella xylanilytica]